MNVLLVGGSGFVGQHLCSELLARDHDVTVLSRNPEPEAVPDGADSAMGDVTAYDSIAPAFEGMDAVYNLVALSPLFKPRGGEEQHDRLHRGGTEHCIRAAEAHDVDRFVQLSALDADPAGPTHYLRAKGRAEDLVRESSLDWTIFRPSVIFGEGSEFLSFTRTLTPPVVAPLPGGGSTRFQPIFVADAVRVFAETLESEDHVGETYEIGGPEVLALSEVATLVREARGQSVRVITIPMGRDQYRSLHLDNVPQENDVTAFGLEPEELTRLEEYLAGV